MLCRFCTVALTLVLSGLAGSASAQTPSFTAIGHIEAFTLTAPGDPLSGATLVVSNQPITLPRNLLITMPGHYVTAQDLFRGPAAGGAVQDASGLALLDPTPPKVPFEAEVIGNMVGGQYVAGVVRISQGALHTGAGFIQAIDPATGEMRIGATGVGNGARVRLNDATGLYGLGNGEGAKASIALDRRFSLDPDNSPVHAKTGFPVCVARSDTDAKCPAGNRLAGGLGLRYTCGAVAAAADVPVAPGCDPTRPAPLRIGDYVTYTGILTPDGTGGFLIAAYGLDAEIGIYTSPGQEPVYLAIEEGIQGTKGEAFVDIPQEETTRFRIVGFTTDPSRSVEVRLVDSGRNETGTSFTGGVGLPPDNGPQLGRFRNTWPAKDDARAVRRDVLALVIGSPHGQLGNGLTSGRYEAPVSQYIYPEPTSFGVRGFPVPVPFENFCFLQNGGGTFAADTGTITLSRLDPFPESGHTLSQPIGTGFARACDGQ